MALNSFSIMYLLQSKWQPLPSLLSASLRLPAVFRRQGQSPAARQGCEGSRLSAQLQVMCDAQVVMHQTLATFKEHLPQQ
jgi:hypothetical protein